MGYSPAFIRGILSLTTIAALAGMIVAIANELLSLGWFSDGYPGGSGLGGFLLSLGAVIAVCWALNVVVDRVYR